LGKKQTKSLSRLRLIFENDYGIARKNEVSIRPCHHP
jgi:hypothetical protein